IAEGGKAVERGDIGGTLLGAAGVAGTPFNYAAGVIAEQALLYNPVTRDEYLRQLSRLPSAQLYRPNVRHAIASHVMESYRAAADAAAKDPNADEATQQAASVVSGLIRAEQFAELGGPQGVRSLVRLAPYGARVGRAILAQFADTRFAQ